MAYSGRVIAILAVLCFASLHAWAKGEDSWKCFQFANTIPPGNYSSNFTSWNSTNWTDMINFRAKVSNATLESCKTRLYKSKLIVLVASPEAIKRTFPAPPPNLAGKSMWSREIFKTCIIKNDGGKRTVYDCGHLFFKGKLGPDNMPTRIEAAHYKTGRFTGNISVNDCKAV